MITILENQCSSWVVAKKPYQPSNHMVQSALGRSIPAMINELMTIEHHTKHNDKISWLMAMVNLMMKSLSMAMVHIGEAMVSHDVTDDHRQRTLTNFPPGLPRMKPAIITTKSPAKQGNGRAHCSVGAPPEPVSCPWVYGGPPRATCH